MTEMTRYVVQARLLGLDKNATKRGRENEYAIDVVLSDESQYTMFRTLKEIANFHTKIMNKFKVESGYFKKEERVIPECPIKQTIFGPQRAIRDDKSFGRLLNHYIKEIPACPAAVVKSDLVTNFFSLKASDLEGPDLAENKSGKKKHEKVEITDDSLISGPLALKSYYTVADYMDKKTKFSFKEGATVQVIQKDASGWWRVDAQGLIGWAPASYLVPVNENDLEEEAEENQQLIEQERVGTRYISISAYQASRDDELSFVRGAVVKVLKKYVDGWWLVRYNGGEGFVPGAMFRKFDKRQATIYVKNIKRKFSSRGTTRIVPTVKPQWMGSQYQRKRPLLAANSRNTTTTANTRNSMPPAPEVTLTRENKPAKLISSKSAEELIGQREKSKSAEDLTKPSEKTAVNGNTTPTTPATDSTDEPSKVFTCRARYEDHGISIAENDKIKVLDDSDADWWYIVDTKGAEGWAPANYLRPSDDSAVNGSSSTPDKPGLGSRTDSGFSLNSSVVAPEMSEEEEEEDEMMDDDMDNDSLEMEECYVVIKEYTKGSIDELDLFEGEMVCVIDDSDKDLWYVNADGKEGWVPSNVLRLMVDEDLTDQESSRESTPLREMSYEPSNDEASDDELLGRGLKRRRNVQRITDDKLSIAPRPRSMVIHKDTSPARSPAHSPNMSEYRRFASSPGYRTRQLELDDGSDSDAVSNDATHNFDSASLEELERAAYLAEKQALEAKLRADQLKHQIRLAKQNSTK